MGFEVLEAAVGPEPLRGVGADHVLHLAQKAGVGALGVAEDIRRDIVSCLASGRIPLRKSAVAPKTLASRNRFIGLSGDKFFFASGQLIEHLQVFVELGEE